MAKLILAFVGMPGAGKSEAVSYLKKKEIPFVRFGQLTDEEVQKQGLPLTPENERLMREKLRKEFGMAAYAIKAKPKLEELLATDDLVVIDGLYSWEEYVFLKKKFAGLTLIHIFAEPQKRYERLSKRTVRPLSFSESRDRDIAELENLNKGGPIAIADHLIDNNTDNLSNLHENIDALLARLHIGFDDTD